MKITIPYFVKKFYARKRLWKRMKKFYEAPWGICDTIIGFSFELFSEFYEKGGIDKFVNWNSDIRHKQARKEIGRLYFWWNTLLPKHEKKLGVLYDRYFEKYPIIFTKKTIKRTNGGDKKIIRINAIETFLEKQKEKNLVSLINIRGYLWT